MFPRNVIKPVRPFLKWAGGKRQLLVSLRQFYPECFGSYVEPFVGSGAVFFDLKNQGRLRESSALLMDSSGDLIGSYLSVRDEVGKVIRNLKRLDTKHRKDSVRCYYNVRDNRFNPQRQQIFNSGEPRAGHYTPSLAAMLIYLNRTGYNGLFRINAEGLFNVPIGRYMNPKICDAENLRSVAAVLAGPLVEIRQGVFEEVLKSARCSDFIYFDPPYAPRSRTALFTSYTAAGFSKKAQLRLQQVVIELALRGCYVMLSNSTVHEIRLLYDDNREAKNAGLKAYKVPARRSINSKGTARGEVYEYIVTNIKRQ